MADEQPRAAEEALHLELEEIGIGIDAPMDAARLDQACDDPSAFCPIAHRGGGGVSYSAA